MISFTYIFIHQIYKKSQFGSRKVPRSFAPPFFVKLRPGEVGVDGAVVIPLPCPIFERDDRLLAEGDNVPLIFPKSSVENA